MATKKRILALGSLLFFATICLSQPVASSKRIVEELEVYDDFKNKNLFYYAPGNLKMALESNGKPKFQLLEMRYTGSSAYGDNGEKRFLNVVQFSVSMEQVSVDNLKLIKQKLNRKTVDIRPLPIRDIEAFVVAPVADAKNGSDYKKIGTDGSFQSEGKSGTSDKNSFWTERTFTIKLENHEAQLLWDQVASGQLALSLGYAFYSDIIPGRRGDADVTHNGAQVKEFKDNKDAILTMDTIAVTQLVKANAFPISVDVKKWPDVLKKIDINEGIPPAYAALEIRCYDFANDLRPDLSIKAIDITATGVGGQVITLPTQKFLRSEPDLYAKQIHFPYAVKLTEPYRYRVVEYTKEGSKKMSEWKTITTWATALDITTPAKDNLFVKKEIDIEVPVSEFDSLGIHKVEICLKYNFSGKPYSTVIYYTTEDTLPIKQITVRYDKDSQIIYEAKWVLTNNEIIPTEKRVVSDDNYLYFNTPKK